MGARLRGSAARGRVSRSPRGPQRWRAPPGLHGGATSPTARASLAPSALAERSTAALMRCPGSSPLTPVRRTKATVGLSSSIGSLTVSICGLACVALASGRSRPSRSFGSRREGGVPWPSSLASIGDRPLHVAVLGGSTGPTHRSDMSVRAAWAIRAVAVVVAAAVSYVVLVAIDSRSPWVVTAALAGGVLLGEVVRRLTGPPTPVEEQPAQPQESQ